MRTIQAIFLPLLATVISLGASFVYEVFILVSLIFALDSVGRYRDFVKLSNIHKRNSDATKSLWNKFSLTRCSREVMMSVDSEAREFYRLVGYKWYHFLPDETFSKNSPFLRISSLWNLSKMRYNK